MLAGTDRQRVELDLDERKREAAEQARPLHSHAREKRQQAERWKERLAERKRGPRKQRDEQAIAEADEQARSLNKEARALTAKAEDIENAVYDLKAVNPNKKPVVDTRTPRDLLDLIEAKGREIDTALAELRASM